MRPNEGQHRPLKQAFALQTNYKEVADQTNNNHNHDAALQILKLDHKSFVSEMIYDDEPFSGHIYLGAAQSHATFESLEEDGNKKYIFMQLLFMFKYTAGGQPLDLALMLPMDAPIGAHRTVDRNLHFTRLCARPSASSEFITLHAVIRGALLVPDFERDETAVSMTIASSLKLNKEKGCAINALPGMIECNSPSRSTPLPAFPLLLPLLYTPSPVKDPLLLLPQSPIQGPLTAPSSEKGSTATTPTKPHSRPIDSTEFREGRRHKRDPPHSNATNSSNDNVPPFQSAYDASYEKFVTYKKLHFLPLSNTSFRPAAFLYSTPTLTNPMRVSVVAVPPASPLQSS
ncbi:hypothetical protein AZE42_10684 [Rhizopogon vesiculosus]|uniref:Uncharacterized protein n=1 Tax=Rhizopogon vesiculosus TaxID=180088 RepID=A0A1J8QW72_9AGAM|nr:hypothetical protein AZE42_10684 [Rhizopogon vesiculosus]